MQKTFINHLYDLVEPHYKEPQRVFHDISHIDTGLYHLTTLEKNGYIITDTQKAAWLFHDIVYQPNRNDNEEKSAYLFAEYNKTYLLGFDEKEVEEVKQIILDTIKHRPTIDASKLILDIDMLVLGTSYEDFLDYRSKIEKEYSPFYSDVEMKEGTKLFIDATLQSERIFHTDVFSKFNQTAFRNLELYKKNNF